MKRLVLAVLAVACLALAGTGCKTDRGSQEYRPGKGWRPV